MNFAKAMEEVNKLHDFGNFTKCKMMDISEGRSVVEMEVCDFMSNPVGTIHGGALFTLADIAVGSAASSYGAPAVSQSISFHFLRAATMDCKKITAYGNVIKRGKRSITIEVKLEDDKGNLIAMGLATNTPLQIDLGIEVE